jgi:hypothetical protein
MNSREPVTYETVRRIAHTFADVEDGLSYRARALKVRGELFVRLREELDSIVIRSTFARRDELIAAEPGAYYITEHYRDYPWLLVRLDQVRPDALGELLRFAYDEAARAQPRRVRKSPAGRRVRRR